MGDDSSYPCCLNPEFTAKLSAYPPSTVATPHLFQKKIAVPGICAT